MWAVIPLQCPPSNGASMRPRSHKNIPQEKILHRVTDSALQEDPLRPCSRCQHTPRLPSQRWCRACLTEAQRLRRAASRDAVRVTAPLMSPARVTPTTLVRETPPRVPIEVCGHHALPAWPRGCGRPFPAKRLGQVYCCNLHGAGKSAHSAECPLWEQP